MRRPLCAATDDLVAMMRPDPRLAGFVRGYLLCDDRRNRFPDATVMTAPGVTAIATFHLGDPNLDAAGRPVPAASILGLQTKARAWRAVPRTRYVAILLTAPGLHAFFPQLGAAQLDGLHDLRDVVGHATVSDLFGVVERPDPEILRTGLDRSLLRLKSEGPVLEAERLSRFCSALLGGDTPDQAATASGMSLRTAQRHCRSRFGLSPRGFVALARLQASIGATQAPADGMAPDGMVDGFYDQSHMIRTWKRALGTTPAAYRRGGQGVMARAIGDHAALGADALFL